MARQPARIDGDYVMVGESQGEDGIVIDDRLSSEIARDKDRDDYDDWDKPEGERGNKEPKDRSGSLLGGRDADEDKSKGNDEIEEEDEEDVRLAYEDPDDEAPRERVGRRMRRNRSRRTAITARDIELETLRERLARTEKLISGTVGSQFMSAAREVEQRIAGARSALAMADTELARAFKEADGDAFTALTKAQREAQQELWALQQHKDRLEQQAKGTFDEQGNLRVPEGERGGAVDPRLKAMAERYSSVFQDRFKWFKPDGNSRDDRIVREIDRELAAENRFGIHDQAYWLEFEDRMKEAGYRPGADRADARLRDDDETYEHDRTERRPNRPPTGGVRPSRPGNDRGGKRLTETENNALRQLGLLEEPGEAPIKLDKAETEKRDRIVGSWLAAKKQQR